MMLLMLRAVAVLIFMGSTVLAQDFDAGLAAARAGDFTTASKVLRPLAEDGDARAQYILGFMHYNAKGVPEDLPEAARWYRLAAEQGHMTAQFVLGILYENGEGVPKDPAKALRWHRSAAQQGHEVAQARLGFRYEYAEGVAKDLLEAVYWYRLAAEQGHAVTQSKLGFIYYYGKGVPKDLEKALHWYRLAAEQGNASAQSALGSMYEEAEGVPADSTEAMRWYRLAAEQGNVTAQSKLGFSFYYGKGAPKDLAEAAHWFHLAADQGDAKAQSKLGFMYENAKGVRRDPEESARWYHLAAEQGQTSEPEQVLKTWQDRLIESEDRYGPESSQILGPLRKIGDTYRFEFGFGEEALATYQRGFELSRQVLGEDHPETLGFLSMYCLELYDAGRHEEALHLRKELVSRSKKVFGPTHRDTLYRIGSLSADLSALGQAERASQVLLEGMQIAERVYGEDDSLVKTSLGTQIMVIDGTNPDWGMVSLLAEAVKDAEKTSGAFGPKTLFLMSEHAGALSNTEQYLPAMEVWSDIVTAHLARLMVTSALDEDTRKAVINDANGIGIRFADTAWKTKTHLKANTEEHTYKGRNISDHDLREELAAEALFAVQMGQSGAAHALARSTARLALRQAGLQEMFSAYETTQYGVLSLSGEINRQLDLANAGTSTANTKLLELQNQREQAIDDVRAIKDRLDAEFPRLLDMMIPQPVTVGELQGRKGNAPLLGPNEALVLLTPPQGSLSGKVWAVSREGLAWAEIAMGEDTLRDEIERLHGQLDGGGATQARSASSGERGAFALADNASGPSITGFDRALAHELYSTLLGDPAIQAVIADKSEWILAPQGMLLSLPFAALVTRTPAGDSDGDADPSALRATHWLGIERALSVVPAVSSVRVLRRTAKAGAGQTDRLFFGLGDPTFNGKSGTGRGAQLATADSFFRSAVADPEKVRGLARLPGTRREIEKLAAVFDASQDAILLGSDASERGLARAQRSGALSRSQVVVFATHGLMAGAFDGLAEPALALSPPACGPVPIDPAADYEPPANGDCADASLDRALNIAALDGAWVDDGLLTASEVTQLNLDADWVILSACDTAAGENQTPDAEGLSGLARAFFFAGARSLLVSHWPVRDDVAARLTPDAVARASTGKMSRAEAFRQAMADLMNDTGADASGHSYAHPAAWAPFQVTGVEAVAQ